MRPDFAAERAEVVRSLDEAVAAAEEDAFVIGGETLDRALLARCERVYVTKVSPPRTRTRFSPISTLRRAGRWRRAAPCRRKMACGFSM
ncbi:MAG: dihydrofolate reductase [Oscillospiraceae bacterium]